jgi:hypothetical protein
MCYLKSGSDTEARAALDKLIREFPEQEQLVAQARDQLASVQPALALEAVPWEDGESLDYRISLAATGKVLGALYMTAESAEVDGIDAWQLELRKFVPAANNDAVSRVLVDRNTQRPISSEVRSGLTGDADTTYGPEGAEITSQAADGIRVDYHRDVYDNEQSMQLIRMLPLEEGYKTSISFLVAWTAQVIAVGVEVKGKELCQVPAGEFDCYAVELEIGKSAKGAAGHKQTLWYSTGPGRYMVKMETGGALIELAKIGRTGPGEPAAFSLDDFGLSGTVPAGWHSYHYRVPDRDNKAMVRVLDPDAEAIGAIEVDRCPNGNCPPLKSSAERELEGARERFEAYELREGGWTERTIDGRPAISFIGDYKRDGESWVQYRIYTMTDDLRVELIFRAPADRFEELRPAYDSVADNLKAK